MKKILMLFLTILLGAQLFGCSKVAEIQPIATSDGFMKYTMVTPKEKENIVAKAKEKITNTVKITLSIKQFVKNKDELFRKEVIMEIYRSNDPKIGYIKYNKFVLEQGGLEGKVIFEIGGEVYVDSGKSYANLNGTIKLTQNDNIMDSKYSMKFFTTEENEDFVPNFDDFNIEDILDAIPDIKKSKDGKMYCSEIEEGKFVFIDNNFNVKQIYTIQKNQIIIINIDKTNVKVPQLTEEQKNTYKEGGFEIPGIK